MIDQTDGATGIYSIHSIGFPLRAFGPVTQDILSDLACTGLWQLGNNLNFPGHHKPADARMILRPLDHIRASGLGSGLDSNEGLWSFTPMAVANCSHAAFEYVWMGHQ